MPNAATKREQDLASDQRAGTWARATARNRQRSFVRRHAKQLATISAVLLGTFGSLSLLVPQGFQRGFLAGIGVASTIALLHASVLLLSGTGSTVMGDLAEQWTAQELRPLTDHGWKLVNHFGLGYGDNDHVLVGPGGVILFETKWNGHEWKAVDQDPRVRAAIRQVQDGARSLRLWEGLKKHGVTEVRTVVVLWGSHENESALPASGRKDPDGTVVIPGGGVKAWAMRQGREKMTPDQVSSVWNEMQKQLIGRDALEQVRNPLPRSMQELVMTAVGCLVVACLAVVGSSSALEYSGSLLVWGAYTAAAIAAGFAARRRPRWRLIAHAWLLGSALTPLLGGLAVAWASLAG